MYIEGFRLGSTRGNTCTYLVHYGRIVVEENACNVLCIIILFIYKRNGQYLPIKTL